MYKDLIQVKDTGYKIETDEGLVPFFTTNNPDYWLAIKPSGRKVISFSHTGTIKAFEQSHNEMLDWIFTMHHRKSTQ